VLAHYESVSNMLFELHYMIPSLNGGVKNDIGHWKGPGSPGFR
jgi:hypothetical protein